MTVALAALPASAAASASDLGCGLSVQDAPNDKGRALQLRWHAPPDSARINTYRVLRRDHPTGEWLERATLSGTVLSRDPQGLFLYDDRQGISPGQTYEYRLAVVWENAPAETLLTHPVAGIARAQWFDSRRLPTAIALLLFGAVLLFFIRWARGGRDLFIRRIAGLEAVDEAVGRATEMGRPILYSPGLDPMEEVATVASINILSQVARKAAEYETRLIMPNRDPIVMTVAQEVVREAYASAGRPDLYDPNEIYYTTQSQFGYAAAVCGTMMRERPATNFFIGHFYAESLILAETGNATGAIQIAGTDSDSQLPFFITACDYTLIGEELYAGSVYLSREPLLLGALKGQDAAKVLILALLLGGTLLMLLGVDIRPLLK
jgi:hypothetical protein